MKAPTYNPSWGLEVKALHKDGAARRGMRMDVPWHRHELDVMESVMIGEHTLIAQGCFITDHNHGIAADRRIDQQQCVASPVVIGANLGLAAKVASCLGAVIAAAAVVREKVEPGAVVAGVPARQMGRRT